MTGPLRVVAHEATRTGAPAVLVGLLRFARGRLGAPVDVRLRYGGPLAEALRSFSDGAADERPAAVLANSALAADAVLDVARSTPTAVYVHEEGDALRGLPESSQSALRSRADLVLTVSDRSRADLIALGVPAERISLLPPLIDIGEPPTDDEVARARSSMTTAADVPLVLACGEVSWRKGADLFVAVVAELRRRRPVDAAWVGRRFAAETAMLDHDAATFGLGNHLRWLGEVDRPLPHLAAADVVVMTSREDPRPMVPIEAALVGTPTVGFSVGGLRDLHEDGAALAVPYPDVVALAERTCELLDDQRLRESLVRQAAARASKEQSVEVVGPLFVDHMRSLLGRSTENPSGTGA